MFARQLRGTLLLLGCYVDIVSSRQREPRLLTAGHWVRVFQIRKLHTRRWKLAMEDPPALASLSLTHVHYDPTDKISYISAWLALVPQGLCIMYVTLIWATREVEILMMFGGQMACEALNWGLKRYIKEDRPKRE